MRIIAKRTLMAFVETQRGKRGVVALERQVQAWHAEVAAATWSSMAELKQQYRSASVVSADRVVFNIKGNDYRLVVAFDFKRQIAFVKWIGTHEEYDKIDVRTVGYVRD